MTLLTLWQEHYLATEINSLGKCLWKKNKKNFLVKHIVNFSSALAILFCIFYLFENVSPLILYFPSILIEKNCPVFLSFSKKLFLFFFFNTFI